MAYFGIKGNKEKSALIREIIQYFDVINYGDFDYCDNTKVYYIDDLDTVFQCSLSNLSNPDSKLHSIVIHDINELIKNYYSPNEIVRYHDDDYNVKYGKIDGYGWDEEENEIYYTIRTENKLFHMSQYEISPINPETINVIEENKDNVSYTLHDNEITPITFDKVIIDLSKYSLLSHEDNIMVYEKKKDYPTNFLKAFDICGYDLKDNLYAKACGKLTMLLVMRDAWWKIYGDWTPKFDENQEKYCICFYLNNEFQIIKRYVCPNTLFAFPTEELALKFLKSFNNELDIVRQIINF
jgi:hypothetical protein